MAETLLSGVAQGIRSTLGSQLLQEIGLLWGVQDEFQSIRATVTTIQAVLLDAEEKSAASNQLGDWLTRIKEAMNDAENLLDDFSYEALWRKVMPGNKVSKEVRLFFSSSNQPVFGLKMAHRIKNLRARLDAVAADSRNFGLVQHRPERPVVHDDRRQTHSHPPEKVVGTEGDKDTIVQLLLSEDYKQKVGIVPIVGMGGLGKTTLAQLVFRDDRVKTLFELRIWICVSDDDFDVKAIVKKILGPATKETVGDIEMDLLVDMLHEKINGKKYLLVLDDVWNEDYEKWSKLNDLLLGGPMGSRIIVTTRQANIAEMIRPMKVYNLQGLSRADSWSLFAQMAFQVGEVPSRSHKEIGEEIVAKCSGVPLAIKAVGSLLYSKTTFDEWSSFGMEELGEVEQGNIFQILKISYDHLPSYLKHCFAYCCLFPKDHMINVPKLITLWMSQGYLNQHSTSRCLEGIGLGYFTDLLWRSFFQEVTRDRLGNIETCKMHDLMHELARKVTGSDVIVSNPEEDNVRKKTRHVSFNFDPNTPWKLPVFLREADDVRTFLLLHDAKDDFQPPCIMDEKQWEVFTCKLRRLRSLDLHSSGIVKVPRSISKLRHLRDLDLSRNREMERLPNSITQLYNLQVLRLEWCSSLIELPKDIHRLIKLSQLDLRGCFDLKCMPRGLGKLTSLHILTKFVVPRDGSVSKWAAGLDELHDMNNLRGELYICNLFNATSDQVTSSNLKVKEHLQCLTLDWNFYHQTGGVMGEDEMTEALQALEPHGNLKVLKVVGNGGSNFPNWLSSLTNLVDIEIRRCEKCRYIPPLHQLPYLRRLVIFWLDAVEYVDSGNAAAQTTSSFFPSLDILELGYCPNLKGWSRPLTTTLESLSRLPILSQLFIRGCPNLASMPLFPPLKSLEFGGGSVKSLQDILMATVTAEQNGSSPAASSSSISLALSQLKELTISEIEDLEFLPEELLCHMGSLKALKISGCSKLKALGRAVRYLTSLETLSLWGCRDLNLSEDDSDDQVMHWQALRCFRSLALWSMPFESLPKWLLHLKTIQEMDIWNCGDLVSLPVWLIQLTSLERLTIDKCTNLSGRCDGNKGEDWPCIAHIPNIKVNKTVVQRNGRYLLS